MKRGAIWLAATLMLATSSLSCSGGRDAEIARLKSELAQKEAVASDRARYENSPKLWLDTDAADSIKLLGYDTVYVFRWQHGEVEGWVEFDAEGGPKQTPLDSKPPNKGEKREAADVSGNIVIALRRETKSDGPQSPTDTFQLEMGGKVTHKKVGGSVGSGYVMRPTKVRMDPNPNEKNVPNTRTLGGPFGGVSDNDNNQIVFKRFVGQKEIPWLKLKLVEQ